MTLLIINLICLGGLIVLLCVSGPNVPLILLLIGTLILAFGKIIKGLGKTSKS
jgi:hypothetical protein